MVPVMQYTRPLYRYQTALHHGIENRQKCLNLVRCINDFDDHWMIIGKRQ